MAFNILWATSFDRGTLDFMEPGDYTTTILIDPAYAYGGSGYGIRVRDSGSFKVRLSPTRSNLLIMMRLLFTVTNTGIVYIYLTDGQSLSIRWDGDAWDAYVGSTKVADGAHYGMNNYRHLAVAFSVANSGGTIKTWIDGFQDINYTGDTQPGTSDQIDYVMFLQAAASGGYYLDNLVIGYGDFPGEVKLMYLPVSADTAQADWTPSSGSDHYALVDEIPASDSDYLEADTNDDQDNLELPNQSITGLSVLAVIASVRGLNTVADGQQLAVGVSSNGVEALTTRIPSTVGKRMIHVAEVDPNTSAAWDQSGIDAVKLVIKAVIP